MNFLKGLGIHLDKVEHRNWAIRIITTILFIAWWNWFTYRMEMDVDPTRIDQLGGIYALAYVGGMFIWACVGFTRYNDGWYDEPKGENSIHFDPNSRAHYLAYMGDKFLDSNGKIAEELNYLKEKYKSELKGFDKKEKILKKEREENEEGYRKRQNTRWAGSISPNLVCPHCQTKGEVYKKTVQLKETSREKGIIGATIGRKTITNKGRATEMYCENCETTWQV
jgi:hypothetical protein